MYQFISNTDTIPKIKDRGIVGDVNRIQLRQSAAVSFARTEVNSNELSWHGTIYNLLRMQTTAEAWLLPLFINSTDKIVKLVGPRWLKYDPNLQLYCTVVLSSAEGQSPLNPWDDFPYYIWGTAGREPKEFKGEMKTSAEKRRTVAFSADHRSVYWGCWRGKMGTGICLFSYFGLGKWNFMHWKPGSGIHQP